MSEMRFVRTDLADEYGILDFQDKLLEIMVYIDQFCAKYDIDYCLMAGSALGARRYSGFIPWDDDIDIYMTEEGYDKFRRYFLKYADKEKYYLQEWGSCVCRGKHMITMAKVRLNKSEIKEKAYLNWKMHQGIFVDIFVLHNCADTINAQRVQYACSEAVVLKGLEIRGYKAKNCKDRIMLLVTRLLPRKLVLKVGLSNAYKYQNKKTEYCHGFIDTRKFSRAVFPKEIMFPGKYVEFETVKLKVPANNDAYLKIQFGNDYMTPPPIEKREVNKHASGWNVSDDIIYDDFSDELKLI